VNATFDDTLGRVAWWDDDGSRPENDHAGHGAWDSPASADANTRRFIEALPQYRDFGIPAVNLNFQGGHPIQAKTWIPEAAGSAGRRPNGHRDFYHNSAFRPDGSIDPDYADRIDRVITACDDLGMVVILQLFYFGQDTVFQSEDAVREATRNAMDFVCDRGYTNVLVEIANEVMAGHYHHDILKPARAHELILLAREHARDVHERDVLVSTSEAALLSRGQWTEEQVDDVFAASDFVLLHGGDGSAEEGDTEDTEVARKIRYIRARPWYQERSRPIIFNESDGATAFDAALAAGVSFGLHSDLMQTVWPPKWGVWDNDTLWFYERARDATGSRGRQVG
jgi:hypothetical protein